MKTRKLLMLLLILIGLMFFVSQEVIAECPDGKIDITVANPGGKVIELCVPEQVVDKIGGPTDIVIPSICPCYSPSELDCYTDEYLGMPDTCDGYCNVNDPLYFDRIDFVVGMDNLHTYCMVNINDLYRQEYFTTFEEYEACRVSLLNSNLWSQCCEQ